MNQEKTHSFRLRGRKHVLSKQLVEDALKNAPPGQIDTYSVAINGRDYPPKQVLAAALGIAAGDFITTDATRILRNLGFQICRKDEASSIVTTNSEELFEAYLLDRGMSGFRFEEAQRGTSKRPDYTLEYEGKEILLELKQFEATPADFRHGGGAYDPYRPIREKINSASRNFQDIEDSCCCLVLYNLGKPLVDLEWRFIYGAMLGNLSIRIPCDFDRCESFSDKAQEGFFGGGGKMIRYGGKDRLAPQNTTISAVIALEDLPVGRRRFESSIDRREKEIGQRLGWEEVWRAVEEARGTERDSSLSVLRVVVCENPYARIPLSRGLFRGPYDERYGLDDQHGDRITRLFVGDQIHALETLEEENKSPTAIQRIVESSQQRRRETNVEDSSVSTDPNSASLDGSGRE